MLSKIFLKRSLFESLVGAELFIPGLPGTSVILEDSSSKPILFNEETGKFINLDAVEDLPLVVKYSCIKHLFDNYIGVNTILKLKRLENSKYIEYLINPLGVEGVTYREDIGLWVKGNFLRKDEKEDSEWKFTADAIREKVIFSFTLFPNTTWYIDLPRDDENYEEISKRISEELERKDYY